MPSAASDRSREFYSRDRRFEPSDQHCVLVKVQPQQVLTSRNHQHSTFGAGRKMPFDPLVGPGLHQPSVAIWCDGKQVARPAGLLHRVVNRSICPDGRWGRRAISAGHAPQQRTIRPQGAQHRRRSVLASARIQETIGGQIERAIGSRRRSVPDRSTGQ